MPFLLQPFHFGSKRVSHLWWTFHAAPPKCRDKVLAAASFCFGTSQDGELILYLEVALVVVIVVGAFFAGRLTADRPLCAVRDRRRDVRIQQPKLSGFSEDGDSTGTVATRSYPGGLRDRPPQRQNIMA